MIKATCIPTSIITSTFSERKIMYAFHDIDGTHSLIRNWPPVMSIVLNNVIMNGLPDYFDSESECRRLIQNAGLSPIPETDSFCVKSAGLSALTQMEWAIRRAIQEDRIIIKCDKELNRQKINWIWQGQELFPDSQETPEMEEYLQKYTPRLFRFYERVLNGFCRDKNLADAKKDPSKYQVPGSMKFLQYLRDNGVKNYFVTGAVVEPGKGMYEEVVTLGYKIGKGELIEDIIGSTWNEKLPKNIIMKKLMDTLNIAGESILVVGDGRAEIQAGIGMGAITISRLPALAIEQRKIHHELNSNIVVESYLIEDLYRILSPM